MSEQSWMLLLIDVSIKSLLLAVVAWLGLTLLQVRNANVRHRVWSAVLVAMLILPLLVPVTPTVPLPDWMLPKIPMVEIGEPLKVDKQIVKEDTLLVADAFDANYTNEFAEVTEAPTYELVDRPEPPWLVEETETTALTGPAPTLEEPEANSQLIDEPASTKTANALSFLVARWPQLLLAGYAFVVSGFFLRILAGTWCMLRLVKRSVVVTGDFVSRSALSTLPEASRTNADLLTDSAEVPSSRPSDYAVYESNDLRVPLTVGFFRPKILLPSEWRSWPQAKLESVLAHETAHIRRGDYLVTLLAEFNRAIHWYHPLAWLLRGWLSELAEQNCDDAVIASTGERTQYARHLLEVASSLSETNGELAWSGVAMARKANVESRIDAILDSKRPLAKRLGLPAVLLLLTTTIPAVLLAAALGPSGPAEPNPEANADDSVIAAEAPSSETSEEKIIRGTVVDPNGSPVEGATVYAEYLGWDKIYRGFHPRLPNERIPVAETKTKTDGSFELDISRSGEKDGWHQIIATATGFAPAGIERDGIDKHPNPTIQLLADTPIDGLVVDTEGQPISGVTLKVVERLSSKSADAVTEWIENERPDLFRKGIVINDAYFTMFPYKTEEKAQLRGGSRALPADVITDADGRFRFTGLGTDQLVILEASGPIMKQHLSVVTRQGMKQIQADPITHTGTPDAIHHGAKVRFVARPTQPIRGRLLDEVTNEPIPNTQLVMYTMKGMNAVQRDFLTTRTDELGRFEIVGAPAGGGHTIAVEPVDQPYLYTRIKVDETPERGPYKVDLKLRRVKWISGRILDESGQPVYCSVHFRPYKDNENAKLFPNNYDPLRGSVPRQRYFTDEEGHFRVPAIPGLGMLAASIRDYGVKHEFLPNSAPIDEQRRMGVTDERDEFTNVYDTFGGKAFFSAFREVNVDADAEETLFDLTLRRGKTRKLKLVDDDGRPTAATWAYGLKRRGYDEVEGTEFTVFGLEENETRLVMLKNEETNLGATVAIRPGEGEETVVLRQMAKLTGQFVDNDGEPIEHRSTNIYVPAPTKFNLYYQGPTTDEDGKFSVFLPADVAHPYAFVFAAEYAMERPNFSVQFEPKPGTNYDVGKIKPGTKLGPSFANIIASPATGARDSEITRDSLVLELTANETVSVGDDVDTKLDAVRSHLNFQANRLRRNGKSLNDTTIVIRTDAEVAAGSVQQLIELCQAAGFEDFQLRVIKKEPTKIADKTGRKLIVESGSPPGWISTRIRGQVVDHAGKGTKATIYLNSVYREPNQLVSPGRESILFSFETDANGNFDLRKALPPRDNDIEGGWGRVEQLVAKAKGHAVAMSDVIDVRKGKAVKLQLGSDDIAIEGRILDLEGQPVEGATLRVAKLNRPKDIEKTLNSLRVRAGEKPKEPQVSFVMNKAFDDAERRFVNERNRANSLNDSKLAPKAGITDTSGRFRIDGVGRDRILALEISGPGIVTSWISVITRDMKPIGATMFVANRTDKTYGAKFTFSAEPHQLIEGVVTDAETGDPIPGVAVESDSYQDGSKGQMGFFQPGNARTVTDERGTYRLTGLPQSKEHHLRLVVPNNQPYLSRPRVSLKEFAEGLRPTKLDFKLKRTGWIAGSVKDKLTGEPVRARVLFSPHQDNERGKEYSLEIGQYVDPIRMKHVAVDTDERGKFRIKAVPGEGLLMAVAKSNAYCPGNGAGELGDRWFKQMGNDATRVTKTYHHNGEMWMHAFKAVTAKLDGIVESDIELDPGNTVSVSLVDPDGESISGVSVRNRVPVSWRNEIPSKDSKVDIVAVQPTRPRAVLFYHRERNLGGMLLANQSQRKSQKTVRMEECGVVKGRLLDKNGKPIAGVGVGLKPSALKTAGRDGIVPYARTNERGQFTIKRFTPSVSFSMSADGPEPEVFAQNVVIKPGENRELGDIKLKDTTSRQLPAGFIDATPPDEDDEDEKQVNGEVQAAPSGFAVVASNEGAAASAESSKTSNADQRRVYEGQVLLPNNKPAVGADVYFVRSSERSSKRELPALPMFKTDNEGRFRFERPVGDVAESSDGYLVAILDGYAAATAMSWAMKSEDTKEALARIPHFGSILAHDHGPMRLLPDDAPIRGKVVDLEGNGIADVTVSVSQVLSNINGDSSTWDEAIKNPKLDWLTLDNLFPRQIRGPRMASIFKPVTTKQDGSFEIRGLGKHRVVKLVVRGTNIEAESFYTRTAGGEIIKLPFQYPESPGRGKTTYYGNQFTHVATPARPIVGRVTDKETGEPVVGAVVNSSLMWSASFDGGKIVHLQTGNDESWTVTDKNGEYRLEGLPRAKNVYVRVAGSGDYLTKSSHSADTSGNDLTPAKLDFNLDKGMRIEGRITNAATREGVQGLIEFFTNSSPGRMAPMRSGPRQKRSGPDGRFSIVVPKKDGQLAFTAFNAHKFESKSLNKINEADELSAASAATASTGAMVSWRASTQFQAVADIKANDAPHKLELGVTPADFVTGKAVSHDGKSLGTVTYTGWANGPNWQNAASDELKVYGIKPGERRIVGVVSEDARLSGFMVLKEPKDGFTVKLQPWSAIRGRIVDSQGEPREGARIQAKSMWHDNPKAQIKRRLSFPPVKIGGLPSYGITTDKNGDFEIHGLVADFPYDLLGDHQGEKEFISNDLAEDITMKVGELKNLGDVVLRKMTPEEMKKQAKAAPFAFEVVADDE